MFSSVDTSSFVSEEMTDYVALCQAMVESVFGESALDDDYIVNFLFAQVFPKLLTTQELEFLSINYSRS